LTASIGYFGFQPKDLSIDDIKTGQRFDYEFTQTSIDQATNNALTIAMIVDDAKPEKKLFTYLTFTDDKNIPENTFAVTKANNTVQIDSKIPIIADIRPELPNLQIFPENLTDPSNHWIHNINQTGEYQTNEGITQYYIEGISDFTVIGSKRLTLESGTFDCIGIKQITDYSMNEAIIIGNKTTDAIKTGYIYGEIWIDKKSGILIRSSFDSRKGVSVDLSKTMTANPGFEKVYREVSVDLYTETELKKISNS